VKLSVRINIKELEQSENDIPVHWESEDHKRIKTGGTFRGWS